MTPHAATAADPHAEIRAEVRKLCMRFPGEYWREPASRRGNPTDFVTARPEAGWLAAPTHEEFGGAGLDRMFVTSAADGVDEPHGGDLFELAPGCRGLAPGMYAG